MDISFYQMGDIYKKRVLLKEFDAPNKDTNNSFELAHSTMGPGHGPSNAKDTDSNQFKDSIMFPQQDIPNSMKKELLIRFFSSEIDNGSWNDKTKTKFKEMLDYLLGLKVKDD